MRTSKIKIAELVTLHKAVLLAGAHPHIGHQSLELSESTIRQELNRDVLINQDVIMSALWSAKMLDEMKLLKSLTGVSFKQLLAATLPNVDEYYFWEKSKE